LKYYNEALDIYKKVLPAKHPNIHQIEEDIEILKKQMKKLMNMYTSNSILTVLVFFDRLVEIDFLQNKKDESEHNY
jgi:hypothetical protein